jgi:hypothetical protein
MIDERERFEEAFKLFDRPEPLGSGSCVAATASGGTSGSRQASSASRCSPSRRSGSSGSSDPNGDR